VGGRAENSKNIGRPKCTTCQSTKKKKRPTKSKENKFLQKNKTGTALVGLLCFDLVP